MNESMVVGELLLGQQIGITALEITTPYDFVLAALSWEQRSTSALKALAAPLSALTLLKFVSTDTHAENRKEEQLNNFRSFVANVEIVELLSAIEFEANALKILAVLRDRMDKVGRPLRILLDITCIPKAYLLYILGSSFKTGYVSRLDCVYCEGEYALDVSHADVNADSAAKMGIISEGDWSSLRVPYFEAEASFPSGRDLFVAMGGEVGLSLPFLERYEPARLGLVLIAESLVQQPAKLPEGERLALATILADPNVIRSDVALADVVSLVTAATNFCSTSTEEVVTAIAIGSKPHALALGIAALGQPNMEVVCRVPKRYRPLDVAPAGRYSFYQIEDRFEPTAYLHS